MNSTAPQAPAALRTFTQLLSSTCRGARLARLLAAEQLRTWDVSPDVTERAEQIVAELAANAGAPRGALLYPRFNREELKGGSWV